MLRYATIYATLKIICNGFEDMVIWYGSDANHRVSWDLTALNYFLYAYKPHTATDLEANITHIHTLLAIETLQSGLLT